MVRLWANPVKKVGIITLFLLIPIAGCRAKVNSSITEATASSASTSTVATVPILSYSQSALTGYVGLSFTLSPSTLTERGAAISNCGIKTGTTALPAGLSIDTTTCVISGTPTSASAQATYTVIATNSAGNSENATFRLSIGTPLSWSTSSHQYDVQIVGTAATKTLTLTNTATVTVSQISLSALSAPYSLSSTNCSSTLAAGTSCTATVSYAPTAIAAANASLTATFASTSSTVTASLTGTGVVASEFLFAPLGSGNLVRTFAINPVTGVISKVGDVASAGHATHLVVHPSRRYAYVANYSGNTISQYALSSGGVLTPLSTPTVATGTNPHYLAIHPTGRWLYASDYTDGNIHQYSVDLSTGLLTALAPATVNVGAPVRELMFEPSGKSLLVAKSTTASRVIPYLVDLATGQLTAGAGVSAGIGTSYVASVTVHPNGRYVYALSQDPNWGAADQSRVYQYTLNAQTGALNAMATTHLDTGRYAVDLKVDPLGRFLYVASSTTGTIDLFTIDPSDGSLTASTSTAVTQVGNLHIDRSGQFLYAHGGNSTYQYSIDQTTGDLTELSFGPFNNGSYSAYKLTGSVLGNRFGYASSGGGNDIYPVVASLADGSLTAGTAVATSNPSYQLAPHPSGRHLYAPMYQGTTVVHYEVDQRTGGLTAAGTVNAGNSPVSATVHPTGKFLYVVNFTGNTINQYDLDPITGAPSPMAAASLPTGIAPIYVLAHHSGKYVYVLSSGTNSIYAYDVDPNTGELSVSATASYLVGGYPFALFIGNTGRTIYTANARGNSVSVLTINLETGILTPVQTFDSSALTVRPQSIWGDPTESHLYVASSTDGTISRFNVALADGQLSGGALADNTGAVVCGITGDIGGNSIYATTSGAPSTLFHLNRTQSTGMTTTSAQTISTGTSSWYSVFVP